MTIAQEISHVADASNRLGPTFSQRKVSSQISVVSGQTVVLAGLISTSKDNTRNGLPLLSRIPVLRDATGDTTKKGSRNELVVLIKPVVIHDGEDAQTVAEDLRSKLWAIGQRERHALTWRSASAAAISSARSSPSPRPPRCWRCRRDARPMPCPPSPPSSWPGGSPCRISPTTRSRTAPCSGSPWWGSPAGRSPCWPES